MILLDSGCVFVYYMNEMSEATAKTEKLDKTEKGFNRLSDWKRQRKKGKITFHLDGSGKVSEVECVDRL